MPVARRLAIPLFLVLAQLPSKTLPLKGVILTMGAVGNAQMDDFDHLTCYRVKDSAPIAPAVDTLENQLQVASHCKVSKKATVFCEETRKNGGDDHRGTCAQRFLCYKLTCKDERPPMTGQQLLVEDQAGQRTIQLLGEDVVCAPVLRGPASCGNNVLDPSEECDPPGQFCRGGCNPFTNLCVDVACQADCSCPDPWCGDEVLDPGEECDPPGSPCANNGTCGAQCTCQQP
jgi:hypothetical protein